MTTYPSAAAPPPLVPYDPDNPPHTPINFEHNLLKQGCPDCGSKTWSLIRHQGQGVQCTDCFHMFRFLTDAWIQRIYMKGGEATRTPHD